MGGKVAEVIIFDGNYRLSRSNSLGDKIFMNCIMFRKPHHPFAFIEYKMQ